MALDEYYSLHELQQMDAALSASISYLRPWGRWTKGRLSNSKGRVCAVGSLYEGVRITTGAASVSFLGSQENNMAQHLRRILCTNLSGRWRTLGIEDYNDAPWRRKRAIIKVMEDSLSDIRLAWARASDMRLQELEAKNALLEAEIVRLKNEIEGLRRENFTLRSLRFRQLKKHQRDLALVEQSAKQVDLEIAQILSEYQERQQQELHA